MRISSRYNYQTRCYEVWLDIQEDEVTLDTLDNLMRKAADLLLGAVHKIRSPKPPVVKVVNPKLLSLDQRES